MITQRFPYEIDRSWSALFLTLGVSDRDCVELSSRSDGTGELLAKFGRWEVRTPLSNLAGATADGPHPWFMAVGLRLAFTNDGLTFGTNHRRGVSIRFRERIPRVFGFRKHSMLWVSVADPDALVAAIEQIVLRV